MVIHEALLPTTLMLYWTNIRAGMRRTYSHSSQDVILVLPYLGLYSDVITRRLKSCVNKFYGLVNLRVILQNTRRIKSFFPYKDRFSRSQKSSIVYKASCWDCDAFYISRQKDWALQSSHSNWSRLRCCWSFHIYRSLHQKGPFWNPSKWSMWFTV